MLHLGKPEAPLLLGRTHHLVFQSGLLMDHLYFELNQFPTASAQDMWKVACTFATTNNTI